MSNLSSFLRKWVYLETTTLSKLSQSQKDKYFSLIFFISTLYMYTENHIDNMEFEVKLLREQNVPTNRKGNKEGDCGGEYVQGSICTYTHT